MIDLFIRHSGDSEKAEESVAIDNWNEETLLQFLEEKLET